MSRQSYFAQIQADREMAAAIQAQRSHILSWIRDAEKQGGSLSTKDIGDLVHRSRAIWHKTSAKHLEELSTAGEIHQDEQERWHPGPKPTVRQAIRQIQIQGCKLAIRVADEGEGDAGDWVLEARRSTPGRSDHVDRIVLDETGMEDLADLVTEWRRSTVIVGDKLHQILEPNGLTPPSRPAPIAQGQKPPPLPRGGR